MGQALKKISPARGDKQQEIEDIAAKCYTEQLTNKRTIDFADFYRTVCLTFEAINVKYENTQLRIPTPEKIKSAHENFLKCTKEGKEKLTLEDFQSIMKDLLMSSGITGYGSTDVLLYMFGIPVTALLIKDGIGFKAFPNEIFIPGVTSATVLLLSKLNKI